MVSEGTVYRWIVYVQQNIPGDLSFTLSRVSSLEAAREAIAEFSRDVGYDDCSATLYPYSEDTWREAQEFEDVGCPFDYPDRIIERGPRGGWRVANT